MARKSPMEASVYCFCLRDNLRQYLLINAAVLLVLAYIWMVFREFDWQNEGFVWQFIFSSVEN